MNKLQKTVAAGALALVGVFGLTGCGYAKYEVMEVEQDEGIDGPVVELEVAREEGLSPNTFEVHVKPDTNCEVGDIYNPKTKDC